MKKLLLSVFAVCAMLSCSKDDDLVFIDSNEPDDECYVESFFNGFSNTELIPDYMIKHVTVRKTNYGGQKILCVSVEYHDEVSAQIVTGLVSDFHLIINHIDNEELRQFGRSSSHGCGIDIVCKHLNRESRYYKKYNK